MKKTFAYLIIILIITSCGVLKKKTTEDKSVTTTETEKVIKTREPSKVVSETAYNIKYKDTTITTTNYETKTVLREVYDSSGNRTAECECEGIREEIQRSATKTQNDIASLKSTEHTFNPEKFIWAIAVLGVVLLLIAGIGLFIFLKAQKTTQDLLFKVVSGIAS